MQSFGLLCFALVFFAMGVMTSFYSLPGLVKTHSFLTSLHPLASGISLKHIQVGLSLLSFLSTSLLLTPRTSRKPVALICVLVYVVVVGNWALPGLTEQERVDALMVSYKGLGVVGGLLLS